MRVQDEFMLRLTMYRENRDHGRDGMQSIANVILNRATRDKSTPYDECIKRLQFSSLTAKGDPELTLYPPDSDPQWQDAEELAELAATGALDDITKGSTLYYNPNGIVTGDTITWLDGSQIPFPQGWNPAHVLPVCTIGGHYFFREV